MNANWFVLLNSGELVSGFNMPDPKKAEESRRLIWSATLGLPPKVDMKQVVFKPNVAMDLPAKVPKWHTLNLPLCEMDSRELHLVCGGQADDAYCLVVRKHEQNMVRVVHWFLDPSRMVIFFSINTWLIFFLNFLNTWLSFVIFS